MIERRRLNDIGGTERGWLRAKHHFALGGYGNPAHKPVGNLFVWNDDEIAPKSGFPVHSHADVEIVTYVREGTVTHRDSLGNEDHIRAGDVQVMSAGTGIRHSEGNEGAAPARLFQIWLTPTETGTNPRWGTRPFPKGDRAGRFVLLASRDGKDGSLPIGSDAEVLGAILPEGTKAAVQLEEGDVAYIVPATGLIELNGEVILARDGAAVRNVKSLEIESLNDSEVVLVISKGNKRK